MNKFRKGAGLWLACCLSLLVLFSCKSGSENSGSGNAITIKINFKPGEKYLYTTKVNQKINSLNTTMDQSMVMEMVYAYEGEEGNNKKLKITYDHVAMSLTTPMGPVQYDSKTPEKSPADMAFMNELIGKSFSIKIAPNGDIAAVEGLGELIKSLSGNADGNTRAAMESQFSDTAIRMMMQNSFDLYPGKEIKVGESWGKKSVMGMGLQGINVNMENTYTLKSISNGKATVAVVSAMNLPATDMSAAAGVPMQIRMNGKQEGTMELDINTGQILSGKTTQNIEGQISGGGQTIPMNITGDVLINSKKL
ncbi:DUF6263 family protein [Taibaiella koreensis]|uniref:DUF6263 family protein n=1 Tax=Taibaiella koreensis TaxID=1268548 RepID=UPI000E59D25A|nr:DUF6263 family protein [Taibaiella koreensis]